MKAGRIKQILQNSLNILENCDDNKDIKLESNTYYCRGATAMLEIASAGFLPLDDRLYDYIENEEDDYEELDEGTKTFEYIYKKCLRT